MNKYLEIGLEEFRKSFQEGMDEIAPGANIRTAGKATKANPHGEDSQWWQQQAPAFIQSWLSWRQANPNLHIMKMEDGSPAIELKVSAQIQYGDEVVELRGYIDRVLVDINTNHGLITDLKTGRYAPNALQLAFYRRALKEAYGIDAQYGAYWMAREGTLSSVHDLSQYSDEVVDYWVRTTYAGIKNEVFLPNITRMCGTCGVKKHCYIFNPHTLFSPLVINTASLTTESQEAPNV